MKFISDTTERVDKFLTSKLEVSRNQVELIIKNSQVQVNNKTITKTGFKLSNGDEVAVTILEAEKSKPQKIDFDVEIIYEDEDLLIINKQPGLIIHDAPSVKEPTLVDWLKHKGISLSTLSGEERHGIVHRIDKETSGALIIAKNNDAHLHLASQLQDKSMGRYYLALIDQPLKDNSEVEMPIGRNPKNRLKNAVVPNAKEAKTRFIKLYEEGYTELIAAKLFTGRTHQIRVHLNALSRYILGDVLYGAKKDAKIPRVMLHAYRMYLKHPKTHQLIYFTADLKEDMKTVIKTRLRKEIHEILTPDTLTERFESLSDYRLYH